MGETPSPIAAKSYKIDPTKLVGPPEGLKGANPTPSAKLEREFYWPQESLRSECYNLLRYGGFGLRLILFGE